MKSRSRAALDLLLEAYPTAEPADIRSQSPIVNEVWNREMHGVPRNDGPWTIVDLVVDGNEPFGDPWGGPGPDGMEPTIPKVKLERFAIWNVTGAVYRVDENGAVEDDPIILIANDSEQ